MNIKKQLSKILVYVEHIEEENAFLDAKVAEHERVHPYQDWVNLIAENKRLSEENARLRDSLRWHPVSELPARDERYSGSDISVNVLFRYSDKTNPFIVWCNRERVHWVDPYVSKILDANMITSKSRWCYIPADNQQDEDGER